MRHPYLAAHPPVLISRDAIADRVAELGAESTAISPASPYLLVGVLKGAAIFLSDLARAISIQCTFDFVAVSSYGKGTRSSGAVKLIKDLDHPIEGRNIILVEDILDTGLTLSLPQAHALQHRPRSLRVATLLDKPERRIEPIAGRIRGLQHPQSLRHRLRHGLRRALSATCPTSAFFHRTPPIENHAGNSATPRASIRMVA